METKYRFTKEQATMLCQMICDKTVERQLLSESDTKEVEKAMRLFDSINKSTRRGILARLLSLFW